MTQLIESLTTTTTKKAKKRALFQPQTIVIWVVVLGGALLTMLPILFMILTSFRANDRVFVNTFSLDDFVFFESYSKALTRRPFFTYLFNSMFAALATTGISLVFCSLAGYGFAKYRFPARNVLFVLVLATLMVPLEVIVIPLYLVVRDFGWLDSYLGLILPVSVSPLGIFLMRQFFTQVPDDYLEAARIDGANEFQIFWRIMVPLSIPALTALAIFAFVSNWNGYLWPLIVTNSDQFRTLPLGMALFENQEASRYNEIMAVALMGALPLFVLFLILQRQFIEGVVVTGLKE